ncbi:MAG: hypothetical protein LC772_10160, partial [Chloroflexi bacterium]|nr:hypothetical protein [Chloroflexota bacterium]
MTQEQPRPGSLTEEGADRYLLSVRMRASRQGKHLGGAERLVPPGQWLSAITGLQDRALDYGQADQVHIGSDLLPTATVARVSALPVQTSACADVESARQDALWTLEEAGVTGSVARSALGAIDSGPGPGNTVMRGAMLIDAATGQRLEPDSERGIRVSRVDYTPRCLDLIRAALESAGLSSPRTVEALAVATKVIWSGVACELC